MEKLPHNDLWTQKLEQVSLPDAGEAWEIMAAILDREMPVVRRRRRLLLWIFLLFLLGGSGYFVWRARNAAAPASAIKRSSLLRQAPLSGTSVAPSSGASGAPAPGQSVASSSRLSKAPVRGASPAPSSRASVAPSSRVSKAPVRGELPAPSSGASQVMSSGEVVAIQQHGIEHKVAVPRQPGALGRSNPGSIAPLGVAGPYLVRGGPLRSSDPLKCPPVERDETRGFVVGIGLNQSIPVDGQQIWTNPSGGLNTWWKDYIPVPFVRYYFQPKIFLQAEARIHAPQYTPKDLWFAYLDWSNSNPSAPLVGMYSGTFYIKELFYFQLPVTVHYALFPNWSIGLGLQYSHYGNGIVAQADSLPNHYFSFKPLNEYPMVVEQHNEFGSLVSLDYIYRRWIIGMSYDESFTKAMHNQPVYPGLVPPSTFVELLPPVRNSSLQLFVRYILWDGRSKDR